MADTPERLLDRPRHTENQTRFRVRRLDHDPVRRERRRTERQASLLFGDPDLGEQLSVFPLVQIQVAIRISGIGNLPLLSRCPRQHLPEDLRRGHQGFQLADDLVASENRRRELGAQECLHLLAPCMQRFQFRDLQPRAGANGLLRETFEILLRDTRLLQAQAPLLQLLEGPGQERRRIDDEGLERRLVVHDDRSLQLDFGPRLRRELEGLHEL